MVAGKTVSITLLSVLLFLFCQFRRSQQLQVQKPAFQSCERYICIMATSVQEKAPFDDDDGQPPEDVPDYDDLIESALDTLDVYQARRADMNMHLKKASQQRIQLSSSIRSLLTIRHQAFFNLAQAKLALGPARVGPASYHHGRVEPLLTV